MPKRELQTLLLWSSITEIDFGQRGFSRRIAWQDSAHLSFDGLSFTMDHRVRSHYAVRTWICLHHFELHRTHPSTHQEDVTCKTPHISCLLQPMSAKCRPLYYQQPHRTRKQVTQVYTDDIFNTALHFKLHVLWLPWHPLDLQQLKFSNFIQKQTANKTSKQ